MKIFALNLLTFFFVSSAVAGGVLCKQCPAESTQCIPKAGCDLGAIECGLFTADGSLMQSVCEATSDTSEVLVRGAVLEQVQSFCTPTLAKTKSQMNCLSHSQEGIACEILFACQN